MAVGGTQTQMLELIRALDRRRFSPSFLCLTGTGELLGEVRGLGIPVYENGIPVSWARAGLARNVIRTVSLLRRLRIQVAHCYLPRGNVVGMLAAKLARVPVRITSKRGLHTPRSRSEAISIRAADMLATRVIANARAVAEYAVLQEGCRREKVLVIPNGVDSKRFRPLGPEIAASVREELMIGKDGPVIGTVTRLRSRKGLGTFVEALAQLSGQIPDLKALVVGDVPVEPLRPALERAGVADRVVFAGVRKDLERVFSAMDLFILASSDGEGMPNVVLEAMACGKPVVVTDVGGSREVVPTSAGVVVKPGDPSGIVSSALNILRDSNRASDMGKMAREKVVQAFSVKAMASATEKVYLDSLRKTLV